MNNPRKSKNSLTETSMIKPVLIVIAGPNGSGKSTLTKHLLKAGYGTDCHYINPDIVAEERFGGWNNPEAIKKAAEYCDELRYQLLEKKDNILFETVFSSPEKLEFIKLAHEKGYFIRFFFISTESPTINAARICQRVMNGGHSVPIEKICSRFNRAVKQAKEIIPFIDRGYFLDNSKDNQDITLIFQTRDGKLHKIYIDNPPSWTKSIFRNLILEHISQSKPINTHQDMTQDNGLSL